MSTSRISIVILVLTQLIIAAFALHEAVDAKNTFQNQPCNELSMGEWENPGFGRYEEHWDKMIARASHGLAITQDNSIAVTECP